MTLITRLRRERGNPFVWNVGARATALVFVALATLLIARTGGARAVGIYALLRVLPGVLGLVISAGLPGAAAYFLAGPARQDPRLRPTLAATTVVAGLVGTALWILASPALSATIFGRLPVAVVALAGLTVFSQLFYAASKACLQGIEDLPGTNWAIVLEELLFVPAYLALGALGVSVPAAIVGGLLLADGCASLVCVMRLARRDFFAGRAAPSFAMARRVAAFGARGQLGSLLSMLNFRLDFVMLGLLTGPGVLGTYAVASKYAELVRLPPLAITWVLYPRYARQGRELATRRARSAIVPAGLLTVAIAVPLALGAFIVFPLVYGTEFRASILPAQILLVGLLGEGIGGVVIAFLYGIGRPGLTSIASGAGLAVTLALDLLLIPRYGAAGAAIASSAAYLMTTAVLVLCFTTLARRGDDDRPTGIPPRPALRLLDITVAAMALIVLSPVMVVLALAVRLSSPGPVIYRQWRVGQGGKPFTLYKFRSMRIEQRGPEVTARHDTRVTSLGRVLRSTALDELPQFFNVLKGDMTLVGPRPETPGLASRYPQEYGVVFQYRPGLTGPVQLRLRDVDIPDGDLADVEGYYLHYLLARRVALDLEYVEAPSVARAISLLLRTVLYLLRPRTAGRVVEPEPVTRTAQR